MTEKQIKTNIKCPNCDTIIDFSQLKQEILNRITLSIGKILNGI